MRSISLLSPFNLPIKMIMLDLGLIFFLTACGGASPSPGGQGIEPTAQDQTPVLALQPTDTQSPSETQAPTETPAAFPTEETSAGSGIDVCTLVTKEEAEAVLGSSVGEPKKENTPPIFNCAYETTDFDVVSVTVVEYRDAAEAEAVFQMEIDINSYEEVSGIGDRALRPYPINDITVLKGKYEVSIDVSDSSEEEEQYQKARELAEKVLSRLP